MSEYAWLDFAYGVWSLVTENDHDPVRYWSDRDSALAEASRRGLAVDWPFSEAISAALGLRSDLQSQPVRAIRQAMKELRQQIVVEFSSVGSHDETDAQMVV